MAGKMTPGSSSERQRRKDEFQRLVAAVAILLVVCQLPTMGQWIYYALGVKSTPTFVKFTFAAMMANCTLNFFLYVAFSKKFRNTLKIIVGEAE